MKFIWNWSRSESFETEIAGRKRQKGDVRGNQTKLFLCKLYIRSSNVEWSLFVLGSAAIVGSVHCTAHQGIVAKTFRKQESRSKVIWLKHSWWFLRFASLGNGLQGILCESKVTMSKSKQHGITKITFDSFRRRHLTCLLHRCLGRHWT